MNRPSFFKYRYIAGAPFNRPKFAISSITETFADENNEQIELFNRIKPTNRLIDKKCDKITKKCVVFYVDKPPFAC